MNPTTVTRSKDVLIEDANISFDSLYLSNLILSGLKENDFIKPSPIQLKAIPLGKCGFDLIVKSKSGTGKTAVFAIIALEMINATKKDLQVLILAPTREIAVQSCSVINSIGKYINGLKVEHFIGGLPIAEDKKKAKGCHIAVGSPGRILQLIKLSVLNIKQVKLFVLDEADNLMAASFQEDINKIYHQLPDSKQMLAVSATYPDDLDKFLANYMQMPTHVSPNIETPLLLGLKHFLSITNFHANVIHLTKIKNNELCRLLRQISFTQCLIFCNYQTRAENISNYLNANGWKSNFISAAQTQQQRLDVMKQLKDFQCRILLSTDLTARGIDAINVNLVINYDVPNDESTYLHRMGRAGRYGTKGICVTIAAKGAEVTKFCDIIGIIGGCEMTVPVLPTGDLPTNIWDVNPDKFETINGTKHENYATARKNIKNSLKEIRKDVAVVNEESIETVQSNDSSEKLDSCSDLSTFDILTKLAAGQTISIEQISNDDSMEIHTLNISQALDSPANENSHVSKSDSDENNDTLNFLKKLASGEEIRENSNNTSTIDTFTKNVSLLNVSTLLVGEETLEANKERDETIEKFIQKLKSDTVITPESNQVEKEKSRPVEISTDVENEKTKSADIEDIFVCAYNYAIDKSQPNWTEVYNVVDEVEEKNGVEPVNLLQDLLDYVADDDEPEYDDYYDEDDDNYDYEEADYEMTSYPEEEDAMGPSLKWIPVEEPTNVQKISNVQVQLSVPKATENAEIVCENANSNKNGCSLYESAVSNFNNTFYGLEDMRSFENAYDKWQMQMSNIRDYIQQNIYIDEMTKFKKK